MTKTLLAAALIAALASPAFARDKPAETSFTRDGETYFYTAVAKTNGVVLNGRYPDGGRFELLVRGDSVTGVSNGAAVSFSLKDAQAKVTQPQLAAR